MASKSDWFEFVSENAAFFTSSAVINKFYPDLAPKSLNEYLVAPIYYAGVDLIYPRMVRSLIDYLSDSSLGRYIIRRIVKLESNIGVRLLVSIGFILAIRSALGLKPNLLQIAQLIAFEFGSDEASDLIY